MKYSFEIKERAIGKQRPRYSLKNHRMYTPTKTSTFEEKVKWAFKSKYNIETGINMNPFKAKITIKSKPAESLGRKAKEELIKNMWDLRRPDIDNITKAILDVIARVDLDNTYISAQKIKDKIEELEKLNIKDNESVKKLEETRRNTDSDFYKKSYQISIHKLNAQIETRKHIISELQGLLEEKGE